MAGDVQLRQLSKHFDDAVAVDAIDAEIRAGEFFSLLGPSGCGKTTTLRMIAGFERPTSGEILLDGDDVAQVPPHRRQAELDAKLFLNQRLHNPPAPQTELKTILPWVFA